MANLGNARRIADEIEDNDGMVTAERLRRVERKLRKVELENKLLKERAVVLLAYSTRNQLTNLSDYEEAKKLLVELLL